ncbi:unnamed protein product [Diamesa hyperborea]
MNQLYSFLPSIRLLQLFGISPFAVNQDNHPIPNKNLRIYSFIQIVVFAVSLIGVIYERDLYLNGKNSNVGNTVDFVQLTGIRIAHFVILCESLIQNKSLIKFFKNLCEIDVMLKKVEIDIDFKLEYRSNFKLLCCMIVFYFGMELIVLSILTIRVEYRMVGYWLSYLFPYLVSCFRYYQVINCVWFIKKRYQYLNDKLEQLKSKQKMLKEVPSVNVHGKSKFVATIGFVEESYFKIYSTANKHQRKSKSMPIKDFEHLILMRELYDKLYVISTMINYSFGLSNLVNIGNDFVAITSNCYFVFLSLQHVPLQEEHVLKVIGSIFWSIPHFVNVFALSAVCHLTVLASNKTALIVHKIDYDLTNENQNLFIEQFSLQLLHQKLIFSAFGFFNVDFTLLFTIAGATTTYLIILIQFHMSEQRNIPLNSTIF